MAEEIDSIFQAMIVKILRTNGGGATVKRGGGTGGTLRIMQSTVHRFYSYTFCFIISNYLTHLFL